MREIFNYAENLFKNTAPKFKFFDILSLLYPLYG